MLYNAPRIGEDTCSSPSGWNSGREGPAAYMTGSYTAFKATGPGIYNDWRHSPQSRRMDYLPFGAAGDAGAAAGAAGPAGFLLVFAGRVLPKEPLNIFPFLVFLSPLPMVVFFIV